MAVTLDTKGATLHQSSGVGYSISVASNSNRMLVVCLQLPSSAVVTSVTYDGVAMTQLDFEETGGDIDNTRFATYYILGPSTGANDLVVTYTGTASNWYGSFYSLYDAEQSAPANNKGTDTTATSTATLTADGDEFGIGLAGSGYGKPVGYSLTGDASSNQQTMNQWYSGDTNGIVAAGSRTAVANYTSGTATVVAMLVLVGPFVEPTIKTRNTVEIANIKTANTIE